MKRGKTIKFTPHAKEKLTSELVLRVVYEETNNRVLVITIYPAKRERYV